jgi:protein O-GlcNAc transferase
MPTNSEALAIARQHHREGRLQEAEQIYQQILTVDVQNAEAWHLLGVIAHQCGRQEIAAEYIGRAMNLNPNAASFHNSLGLVCQALDRLDDAAGCYRRALEIEPAFVKAYNNLGAVFMRQGKLDETVVHFRRAVESMPDDAAAHCNLGCALQAQQDLEGAANCFRRALELEPQLAEAHSNLGYALAQLGRLDEAVACYRLALEIKPDYAEAYSNLGSALLAQGKPEGSVICCQQAIALKPDFAKAYANLGDALTEQQRFDDAIACYRRALELAPEDAGCYNNLGNVCQELGKLDEAASCYKRAMELKPEDPAAYCNASVVLRSLGNFDEAIVCCRRALAINPDFTEAHSNLLFTLHYCDDASPAQLADAHAEFQRRHAESLQVEWQPHANVRDPDRRLRVGFISPDLGRHPVGDFLIRALENLDPGETEIACYSDRRANDARQRRFRETASIWRDVVGMNDQRLAAQIRADEIDILFDLAGHTGRNRMLVFARKPAPVQIAWIGCEGMTGLSAMDYLLADRFTIPEESAIHCRQRVLRMPDGYVCYEPPADAPAPSALPALRRGQVTLGCFNNPAKIGAHVIEVWARIMRCLPETRLILKYMGMDDAGSVRRFSRAFSVAGIDVERVSLRAQSPYGEHLNDYAEIDIALDPFPFNGGVTTCEAMWMGVPVVTCPGATFASRHSLSYLSNVGLTEMIAGDLNEYVELVVALADDLPRLSQIRATLRERMATSPLCDGPRFAKNLTNLLRQVWQEWAASSSS